MAAIVEDGLRAGALGFSTSRTMGHRAIDGEPVPGTFAAEDELFAIAGALAEVGHGVFELAPAGTGGEAAGDSPDAHEAEIDWIVRLAEATGVSVTFLIMQSHVDPERWRYQMDVSRRARADGTPVYPQVASRCFGMLVGHQSRANPFRTRPTYQGLLELAFAERVARLRDPEVRARILAEGPPPSRPGTLAAQMQSSMFEALYPLGTPPEYEPTADTSSRAIADREGRSIEDVAYDAMLTDDGRELLLYPLLNFGNGSYDALYEMMTDPITVQGLGDGGADCGIVCDASMTTYMLSHWVRDRSRGPRLQLEFAVQRLTKGPAALYGLHDRGVLAPGIRGDVNVIDFEHVGIQAPEMVFDLPAGAGRMIQRPTGYVATAGRRRDRGRGRGVHRRDAGCARARPAGRTGRMSLEPVPEDWSRALAVVAHPDDLEYGAASAIARWTDQGKGVAYVLATAARPGSTAWPPTRPPACARTRNAARPQWWASTPWSSSPIPTVSWRPRSPSAATSPTAIRRHRPEVLVTIHYGERWPARGQPRRPPRGGHRAASTRPATPPTAGCSPGAGGDPWSGVRFVLFGGSPTPTHFVDVTDTIDRGVASLREHAVYLDNLDEGTVGKDPEPFLRGMAAGAGAELGIPYATTFELIPL